MEKLLGAVLNPDQHTCAPLVCILLQRQLLSSNIGANPFNPPLSGLPILTMVKSIDQWLSMPAPKLCIDFPFWQLLAGNLINSTYNVCMWYTVVKHEMPVDYNFLEWQCNCMWLGKSIAHHLQCLHSTPWSNTVKIPVKGWIKTDNYTLWNEQNIS